MKAQVGRDHHRWFRKLSLLLLLLAEELAVGAEIYHLSIDGIINPLSARYLERGLEEAAQQQALALVLQLNTPGGLDSSMRRMSQAILNAPLPIVVYVAPAGGRAASAGMFITLAADVAVMAPGTNIGAAHPVALGGAQPSDEKTSDEKTSDEKTAGQDPSLAKAVQDAAAFARTLASKRNRNVKWAEEAVLHSVSISAEEAVQINVVDFLAEDFRELLQKLARHRLVIAGQERRLPTLDAEIIALPMNLPERILTAITDPNIAYLLMTLGTIGVIAELYSPGMVIPGLFGFIALLLAFAALGSLPLNWVGIVFLVTGILLMVLELYNDGGGALAGIGLTAFTLGSLFLYRPLKPVSPAMATVYVNHYLIIIMILCMAAFFVFVVQAVLKTRRRPLAMGEHLLIGKSAIAVTDLSPQGIVKIAGEEWSATLEGPEFSSTTPAGQPVEVIGVEGVMLKVRSLQRSDFPPHHH